MIGDQRYTKFELFDIEIRIVLYPAWPNGYLNGDANMVISQDPQDELRRLFQRAEHLCSPSLPSSIPSSPPLLKEMDVQVLMAQAKRLTSTPSKTSKPIPSLQEPTSRDSAPPCNLSPVDQEPPSPPDGVSKGSSSIPLPRAYTRLVSFIAAAFLLLFGSYFCLDYMRTKEELSAARRTADLGMALSYAKVHAALNPDRPTQTFDPGLMKEWVSKVVSPGLATSSLLTQAEPYEGLPYHLHVLRSPLYSDFLVTAEPTPSWADWLRPRKAWVVFSGDLCLHYARHTDEMATLHQITTGGLSFEASHAFFANLPILPLQRLDVDKSQGFTPPAALYKNPGKAALYLYNAPRYHPFSQGLANAAKELSTHPDSQDHLEALFEQASLYQTFPELVVYNELGSSEALDVHHALHDDAALDTFPIGYVAVEDGSVKSSHLLEDTAWVVTPSMENPYLGDLQALVDAHWKDLGTLQEKLSVLFDANHLRAQDLTLREELLATYFQAHQEAKMALAEAISDLYLETEKEGELSTSLLTGALIEASLFPFLQDELTSLDVLDFGTIASLTVLHQSKSIPL